MIPGPSSPSTSAAPGNIARHRIRSPAASAVADHAGIDGRTPVGTLVRHLLAADDAIHRSAHHLLPTAHRSQSHIAVNRESAGGVAVEPALPPSIAGSQFHWIVIVAPDICLRGRSGIRPCRQGGTTLPDVLPCTSCPAPPRYTGHVVHVVNGMSPGSDCHSRQTVQPRLVSWERFQV